MTVSEFTGGLYTEIKLQANVIKGDFVSQIADLLDKCGIGIYTQYNLSDKYKNCYGVIFQMAVIEFQEQQGLSASGIIDDATLAELLSNSGSDIVYTDTESSSDVEEDTEINPHYDSYFDENNTKVLRRNKQDISINIGNGAIIKTIHDVYLRSVGLEVDTSGNPIYETYEFIAKDVTETDETNDADKY